MVDLGLYCVFLVPYGTLKASCNVQPHICFTFSLTSSPQAVRQSLAPWCINCCRSSGITWVSVWMITHGKAVCLGVFYLLVAYLGKSITKAALELDGQQQRVCGISVTVWLTATGSSQGKHLQAEGPHESLSPHKLLLVSWSNKIWELCKNNGCWVPANTKRKHAFNRWYSKSSVHKGNDPVLWMAWNSLFKW